MVKRFYIRVNCPAAPDNYNRGEIVEWRIGYELTGTPSARNNKAAICGGDVLDWQVKSPKASLAEIDNCKGYIFGFADTDYYYEMTRVEFERFMVLFSYIDYDSKTHKSKVRVKGDSAKMRRYLEAAVR